MAYNTTLFKKKVYLMTQYFFGPQVKDYMIIFQLIWTQMYFLWCVSEKFWQNKRIPIIFFVIFTSKIGT